MNVIQYPNQTSSPTALTIGNFDGVHLGHQMILQRLADVAQQRALTSALLTFEPTPLEFFRPEQAPARITNFADKSSLLEQHGLAIVYLLPFSQAIATMAAADFIEQILIDKLQVKYLLVGDDFRFGHNRDGDVALLKALANDRYEVEVLPAQRIADERVSSTQVRVALAAGDLSQAKALLGHDYFISGEVIHGDERGRTIGFPTANINLDRNVPPLTGVYAAKVHGIDDAALPAVANIGYRPTVDGSHCLLEVHLLDFAGDLYGKSLTVEFCQHIRAEQKFASLEALTEQIGRDRDTARQYFTG